MYEPEGALIKGVNSPQIAVLHNDLATALDGNGKYSEAEDHAQASLDIMSHSQVTDTDVDIEYFARVYYNLGMILTHQGRGINTLEHVYFLPLS